MTANPIITVQFIEGNFGAPFYGPVPLRGEVSRIGEELIWQDIVYRVIMIRFSLDHLTWNVHLERI